MITIVANLCPGFFLTVPTMVTCLSQAYSDNRPSRGSHCLKTPMRCLLYNSTSDGMLYDCYGESNTLQVSVLYGPLDMPADTSESVIVCHYPYDNQCGISLEQGKGFYFLTPKNCTCKMLVTFHQNQWPLCQNKKIYAQLFMIYGPVAVLLLSLIGCLMKTVLRVT